MILYMLLGANTKQLGFSQLICSQPFIPGQFRYRINKYHMEIKHETDEEVIK